MKRLVLFLLAVAAAWVFFYFHDSGRGDPIDLVLALALGVIWTMAVIQMVLETPKWSVRALGILGTIAGDAVLYSAIGVSSWREERIPEGVTDIARSFFVVGTPLFLIAIFQWRRKKHNGG